MGPRAQDPTTHSGHDLLLPWVFAVPFENPAQLPHAGLPEAHGLVALDALLVVPQIDVTEHLISPAVSSAVRLSLKRPRGELPYLEPERSAGHPVPPVAYGGRHLDGRGGGEGIQAAGRTRKT